MELMVNGAEVEIRTNIGPGYTKVVKVNIPTSDLNEAELGEFSARALVREQLMALSLFTPMRVLSWYRE